MSGLANLRELLKDERIWGVSARVALHDGDEKHYFVNSEGDYVISVLSLQHEVPIKANWLVPPGIYTLPDLNDEVFVTFDGGEFEGEAYIVGRTTCGQPVPDGEAGELAPRQTIVVGDRAEIRVDTKALIQAPEVEAASSPGAGKALVQLEQLVAFRDAINSWTPVPTDGGAALKAILTTLFAGPPLWPTGTTVIKGE